MSNTIGRVDFTTTLDGRGTEAEAEAIGRKAGAAAGDGYDKEWNKSFKDTLTKSGQRSYAEWQKNGKQDGTVYGKALQDRFDVFIKQANANFQKLRLDPGFLDDFSRKFDDAGLAAGALQRQLVTLRENGDITASSFRAAQRQVDEWALAQKDAGIETNRHRDAIVKLQDDLLTVTRNQREAALAVEESNRRMQASSAAFDERIRRSNESIRLAEEELGRFGNATRSADNDTSSLGQTLGKTWNALPNGVRRWSLIIAAIAAGMEDMAVLGSAAGAGLIAVGGGAVAMVGGLAAGLSTTLLLNKALTDLPEALRPAAREFQDLKGSFSDLRTELALGSLSEMEGSFGRLQKTIEALTPDTTAFGRAAGNSFDAFTRGVAVGTEGFGQIRQLIRNAGDNFESLSSSAGSFTLSLVRGINRANPLVQKMDDYIADLARRFDLFTRGTGFDVWMRNADTTFSHLGPLIGATAEALADLVTPTTVAQTAQFLDDLTRFMPALSDILSVLGSLNIPGLLAKGLVESGNALEPLLPSLDHLATSLANLATAALPGFSAALGAVAALVAPVAQGLADIIDAVPPEVWSQLAVGALAFAGGLKALQIAAALGVTNLTTLGAASSKLLTSLTTTSGGIAAIAAVGVGASIQLVEGLKQLAREQSNVEGTTRNLVSRGTDLTTMFRKLNTDAVGDSLIGKFQNLHDVLGKLGDVSKGGGISGVFANIGLAFDSTGNQALALSGTLQEIDKQMKALPIQEQIDQFAGYARSVGASSDETLAMINQMPVFKQALIDQANATGQAADDQGLIALAMKDSQSAAEQNATALDLMSSSTADAATNSRDLSQAIEDLATKTLASRDSARGYQQALADATKALQDNGTALNAQGTDFDITTQKGRDNQAAVDNVAQSAENLSQKLLDQGASSDVANQAIVDGRDALIKILGQFGITGAAAQEYANKLGLIPHDISTTVHADTKTANSQIDAFIRDNNGRVVTIVAKVANSTAFNPRGGNVAFASGGTLYGPQHILAGEAGPEAIVPLNRPLDQVDPSVRWLSAIAQGMNPPAMASGGVVGGGKQVTVEAGAIVVEDRSGDSRRTGNEVLQRLAENIVG